MRSFVLRYVFSHGVEWRLEGFLIGTGTGVSTEGHGLLAVVGLNQTGGMLSDSRARFVFFDVHVPTNQ